MQLPRHGDPISLSVYLSVAAVTCHAHAAQCLAARVMEVVLSLSLSPLPGWLGSCTSRGRSSVWAGDQR
jgi:hypothetical protein